MHGRIARLALLAPLACAPTSVPSPGPGGSLVEPSTAAKPAASSEPPGTEPPSRAASSDLYLAPRAGGLVRISGRDASVHLIEPLAASTVTALAADPDDRVYVGVDATIFVVEDGIPTRELPETALGSIDAIHAVSEREVWAAGMLGVASFDGERWHTTTADELAIESPRDVTIDAAGRVWAMGKTELVRRDGDRFVPVAPTEDAKVLGAFVDVPGHALSIVHVGGIDYYDDERWTPADLGFVPDASMPSGRAWGTEWADHGGGTLTVASYLQVATQNAQWHRAYAVARAEHPATVIEGVAVDERGRSFVATDGGLLVIAPPAAEFTWIGFGALPGVENRVAHMLVLGHGPGLPELVDPGRGSVRGKLEQRGQPLAKARVELCTFPRLDETTGHACAPGPRSYAATTRADGTFELEGVVPGRQRLAVEVRPGRWRFFAVTECCMATRPGSPQELGTLDASSGYPQGW